MPNRLNLIHQIDVVHHEAGVPRIISGIDPLAASLLKPNGDTEGRNVIA
jgi:hypothetical protein